MANPLIEKANEVLTAWESIAPQATLAGMSAQGFREALQPLVDVRQRIALLDQQRQGAKASRDTAEKEFAIVLQMIVDSIKGNPAYGKDSELYAAIGYVTRTARQSGLTRKKAQSETVLAQ